MADNPISGAAKELRQRQTEAEKRLWFKLRDNQIYGLKFRRQEPIGNFIVDFVNYDKKVVIEIDGGPHRGKETARYDQQRTQCLETEGFKVLRFWNSEIIDNLDKVVEKIKSFLVP